MPSSRKPSMDQVLTNSPTSFGRSEIWVSRSLTWITFTPMCQASRLNARVWMASHTCSRVRPLNFFSARPRAAMSTRPRLVQCEIRPGFAPCSSTAVAPGVFHRALRSRIFMCRQYSVSSVGCLFFAPAYGSQSSTEVLMYFTPRSWHHWRMSQQSMFHARSMSRSPSLRYLPSRVPMFPGVMRSRTNRTPWAVKGAISLRLFSKSMTVICRGATRSSRNRMGSVHCATDPNPTISTFPPNSTMMFSSLLAVMWSEGAPPRPPAQ